MRTVLTGRRKPNPLRKKINMATAVLTRLTEIRQSYAKRRALYRELDSYMTEGALNDIEAAIYRTETETGENNWELRQVVAAKRSEMLRHSN